MGAFYTQRLTACYTGKKKKEKNMTVVRVHVYLTICPDVYTTNKLHAYNVCIALHGMQYWYMTKLTAFNTRACIHAVLYCRFFFNS